MSPVFPGGGGCDVPPARLSQQAFHRGAGLRVKIGSRQKALEVLDVQLPDAVFVHVGSEAGKSRLGCHEDPCSSSGPAPVSVILVQRPSVAPKLAPATSSRVPRGAPAAGGLLLVPQNEPRGGETPSVQR